MFSLASNVDINISVITGNILDGRKLTNLSIPCWNHYSYVKVNTLLLEMQAVPVSEVLEVEIPAQSNTECSPNAVGMIKFNKVK